MVPSDTSATVQPACVHTALNALNSPAVGWVTTTFWSGKTRPPPTGMSAVRASGPPCVGAAPPVVVGALPEPLSDPLPQALTSADVPTTPAAPSTARRRLTLPPATCG